ncbi:Pre-rRNA-processing protein ipi3 [Blyttiomyces sp. JEL0837]|nr:Pre-rRNA-processing protein ipi3 [Blyttiomyces sp. JEL0837]
MLLAQADKPLVYAWSWHKEQVLSKWTVPEKLSCVSISASGRFVVGGAFTGHIYLWEINSGKMLRSREGHYKAVNAIRFSSDDTAFLTAGADASVHIWLTGQLCSGSGDSSEGSFASLSGHTLPVTDACFSVDVFHKSRIYTASLDRTIRAWNSQTGACLFKIVLPKPLSSLALDNTGMHVYAGATDGSIYVTNMYKRAEESDDIVPMDEGEAATVHVAENDFIGHSGQITGLSISFDGRLLVSSSEDGTARVWDIPTRQTIRVHTLKEGSVTGLQVVLKPPTLLEPASNDNPVPALPNWERFESEQAEIVSFYKNVSAGDERMDLDRNNFNVRSHLIQAEVGKDATDELSQLRAQVKTLAEQNQALISSSEKLYRAACKIQVDVLKKQ